MPSVLPSPLPAPSCLPDVIHLYSSATMSNTSVLLWPGCTALTDTLNQAMLLCFLVVACFWMAVGHVRVDEWMLRMCLCAALLGWFGYNVLTKYVESHRNSHKTALKCVCMQVCVYGLLCLHLQVLTLTPTPSSAGFHGVSFPFLNKTQKRTAMFTVSAQASPGPGPLCSLLPPSHSSHLCWGLAGRKI